MDRHFRARKPGRNAGGSALVQAALGHDKPLKLENLRATIQAEADALRKPAPAKRSKSLSAPPSRAPAGAPVASPAARTLVKRAPALPDQLGVLVSILDGLEAVASIKKGTARGRVLFRADQVGVEQASKRAFKATHVKMLKHLLGPCLELSWVMPPVSSRASRTPAVKDLDLCMRLVQPSDDADTRSGAGGGGTPTRDRSPLRDAAPSPCTPQIASAPVECTPACSTHVPPPVTPSKAAAAAALGQSALHAVLRARLLQHLAVHYCKWLEGRGGAVPLLRDVTLERVAADAAFDMAAVPEPPRAPLPARPSTVHSRFASASPASRSATPVRTDVRLTWSQASPMSAPVDGAGAADMSRQTSLMRTAQDDGGSSLSLPEVAPSEPPEEHAVACRLKFGSGELFRHSDSLKFKTSELETRGLSLLLASGDLDLAPELCRPDAAQQGEEDLLSPIRETSSSRGGESPLPCDASQDGDVAAGLVRAPFCPPTPDVAASGSMSATPRKRQREAATADDGAGGAAGSTPSRAHIAARPMLTPRRGAAALPTSSGTPCSAASFLGASAFAVPSPRLPRGDVNRTALPQVCQQSPQQQRALSAVSQQSPRLSTTPHSELKRAAAAMPAPAATLMLSPPRPVASRSPAPISSPSAPRQAFYGEDPGRLRTAREIRAACKSPAGVQMLTADDINPATKRAGTSRALKFDAPPAAARSTFARARPSAASPSPARSAPTSPPRKMTHAEAFAAELLSDDMVELLKRNAAQAAKHRTQTDRANVRKAIEGVARANLPVQLEHLRVIFNRHGSLVMPFDACVAQLQDMCHLGQGMTRDDAVVHLELLVRSVPDWIQLLPSGADPPQQVRIASKTNTASVRRRLEDIAFAQ